MRRGKHHGSNAQQLAQAHDELQVEERFNLGSACSGDCDDGLTGQLADDQLPPVVARTVKRP